MASPTQLLARAKSGDDKAVSKLMPLVYDELRRLAASYLRRERPGQTLQATALSMRQILVQRARRRNAAKRGGDPERITLDEQLLPAEGGGPGDINVLELDAALERLAALDERQAKVVELRYFGGLTVEETAAALDISPATVKRHWTLARAWLRRELTRE
jgi:RNA polymerase sigma-70 factor (ECF subfamily)